jgi:hypothetical protein
VICAIESQPDEAITVFPAKDVARAHAALLKKLNYSVYADADLRARSELPDPTLPVAPTPTQYGINSVAVEADGALLVVDGWAVDSLAGDVAGGVAVVIDGSAHPACYGLRRDDVAKALKNHKFVCSGFRCSVSAKNIGPGKHSLVLKVRSRDRKTVFDISEEIEFNEKYECVMKPASPRL